MIHLIQIKTSERVRESFDSERVRESFNSDQDFEAGS